VFFAVGLLSGVFSFCLMFKLKQTSPKLVHSIYICIIIIIIIIIILIIIISLRMKEHNTYKHRMNVEARQHEIIT